MGLFDKSKNKPGASTSASGAASTGKIESVEKFYSICAAELHAAAAKKGFAKRGMAYIPELMPAGERAVISSLQDPYLESAFGAKPQAYFHAIMSRAIQAGVVYAERWCANKSAFNANEPLPRALGEAARPFFKEIGLNNFNKESSFFGFIFDSLEAVLGPYLKVEGSMNYVFNGMVAAFQLGVSMVLDKRGY